MVPPPRPPTQNRRRSSDFTTLSEAPAGSLGTKDIAAAMAASPDFVGLTDAESRGHGLVSVRPPSSDRKLSTASSVHPHGLSPRGGAADKYSLTAPVWSDGGSDTGPPPESISIDRVTGAQLSAETILSAPQTQRRRGSNARGILQPLSSSNTSILSSDAPTSGGMGLRPTSAASVGRRVSVQRSGEIGELAGSPPLTLPRSRNEDDDEVMGAGDNF